jgi:hypothetical protein
VENKDSPDGKGGSLLGRLDKQFVVVKLHVRTADEVGNRAGQSLVHQ